MKNKILTMIIISLLSIGIVSAIVLEEDQVFTQEQLDSYDVESLTATELACQKDSWRVEGQSLFLGYFCLTVNKTGSTYTVVRTPTEEFEIHVPSAIACVIADDAITCRNIYREEFRTQVRATVSTIKDYIRAFQTVDVYAISGWFDGWEFEE